MSSRQNPQRFEEAPTFFHIVVPGSRYVEILWGVKQFNHRGSPAWLADCRYAGLRLCQVVSAVRLAGSGMGMKQVEEKLVNGNPIVFFRAESWGKLPS